MIFYRIIPYAIIICFVAVLSSCSGGKGTSRGYYGYGYGLDPWYYHGGYVRDRVHVISEDEIRALEELDSIDLPEAPDPGPDMGIGDMDFGGFDLDF